MNSASMAQDALEARDLHFAYDKDTPVLRGVNLAVRKGALTGIVGPNGCGKSTLLRLLCGLLEPDQGDVLLSGVPLESFSGRKRARWIAYLPQQVNPVFSLVTREVVALGRYPHLGAFRGLGREDLDVVERCLEATGTAALRHREFSTLSGGERQRVLLASILAQEPQLLLLDEPTTALDLHHQHEVFSLLQRLAEEGYGLAVVTHDLNAAARFCHYAYLFEGGTGRIAAEGPPETVFTSGALSQAYGAPIEVARHPLSGTPLVSARDETAGLSR